MIQFILGLFKNPYLFSFTYNTLRNLLSLLLETPARGAACFTKSFGFAALALAMVFGWNKRQPGPRMGTLLLVR